MIPTAKINKTPKTYLLLTEEEIQNLQNLIETFYNYGNEVEPIDEDLVVGTIWMKLQNAKEVLQKPLTL